jgi:hypothetical protein
MEENDLISKKELLLLTGISYGQLYRWKRENLIPESWFIKQSSFTGQETFFPREKVLKRVEMIQGLKDKYTLEEQAKMLSPELTSMLFKSTDLKKFDELSPIIISVFEKAMKKESFTFIELIFIYILSKIRNELRIDNNELEHMALSIKNWIPDIKKTSYKLLLLIRYSQNFIILVRQDAHVFLDSKTEQLKEFSLEDLSKDLNLKINGKLEEIL